MKTILNILLISHSFILFNPLASQEPSYVCLNDIRKYALITHNEFRSHHQSPPLKLNSTLNEVAQKFAIFLATSNLFKHSYDGYGENLARAAFNFNKNVDCKYWPTFFTSRWYEEISQYDFDDPKFVFGTGHFTQLVWKSSTEVGFGFAITNNVINGRNATVLYYVAKYFKPGNVRNRFAQNVLKDNLLK